MATIEAQEQQYVPVNQESHYNPYKPRFISYFTIIFAIIAAVSLLGFGLIYLLTEVIPLDSLAALMSPYKVYERPLLTTCFASSVFAIGSEIYSRTKTPPATWKVKNELVRTLSQYGLLDINDTTHWKGMFAVAPVGRYNRQAKSFTLPFLLRHAHAKESFEQMGNAISGFARCQSAEVLEDNSRRLYNCKLVLWYTDNPYGEISMDDMFED